MSENTEKNTITINDKDFNIDDMNDEQKTLINHLADCDRKIGNSQFNLDQLFMCRDGILNRLFISLTDKEE